MLNKIGTLLHNVLKSKAAWIIFKIFSILYISFCLLIAYHEVEKYLVHRELRDKLESGIKLFEEGQLEKAFQVFSNKELRNNSCYFFLKQKSWFWKAKYHYEVGDYKNSEYCLKNSLSNVYNDLRTPHQYINSRNGGEYDIYLQAYNLLDSIYSKTENKSSLIANKYDRLKTSVQILGSEKTKEEVIKTIKQLEVILIEEGLFQELIVLLISSDNLQKYELSDIIKTSYGIVDSFVNNNKKYFDTAFKVFVSLDYPSPVDIPISSDLGKIDYQYLVNEFSFLISPDFSICFEKKKEFDIYLKINMYEDIIKNGYKASIYSDLGKIDSAKIYFERMNQEKIEELTLDQGYKLKLIENKKIGEAYINAGKYDNALSFLLDALHYSRKLNDLVKEFDIQTNLMKAYLLGNNTNKAFTHYKKANNIILPKRNLANQELFLRTASDLFRVNGNYTKAIDYHQKEQLLKQKKETKEAISLTRILSYLVFMYEVEQPYKTVISRFQYLAFGLFLILFVALLRLSKQYDEQDEVLSVQERKLNGLKEIFLENEEFLVLENGSRYPIKEITHIISYGKNGWSEIHFQNRERLRNNKSTTQYKEEHPEILLRISNKCAVNITHIAELQDDLIFLKDRPSTDALRIGVVYMRKSDVVEIIEKHLESIRT